jgi:iron-sulfur cluster repair protein YtfE (RIC family)
MTDFQQLVCEHDQLELLTQQLLTAVNSKPVDIPALIALRTTLAVSLASHLAKEDGNLYPKLIDHGDYRVAQIAQRFISEFSDIATVWCAYLDGWTAQSIAADMVGFQDATYVVVKRLGDRIRLENAELYPLALRLGAIELRAA